MILLASFYVWFSHRHGNKYQVTWKTGLLLNFYTSTVFLYELLLCGHFSCTESLHHMRIWCQNVMGWILVCEVDVAKSLVWPLILAVEWHGKKPTCRFAFQSQRADLCLQIELKQATAVLWSMESASWCVRRCFFFNLHRLCPHPISMTLTDSSNSFTWSNDPLVYLLACSSPPTLFSCDP